MNSNSLKEERALKYECKLQILSMKNVPTSHDFPKMGPLRMLKKKRFFMYAEKRVLFLIVGEFSCVVLGRGGPAFLKRNKQ